MDAGSDNWNEREGSKEHGIDRQGRMEKENKIETLDPGRCGHLDIVDMMMMTITGKRRGMNDGCAYRLCIRGACVEPLNLLSGEGPARKLTSRQGVRCRPTGCPAITPTLSFHGIRRRGEVFHHYGVHLSSSLLMQISVGWQGYVTMETIWKNTGGFVYD